MSELVRIYNRVLAAYMSAAPNSDDEIWYLESFAFLHEFIFFQNLSD